MMVLVLFTVGSLSKMVRKHHYRQAAFLSYPQHQGRTRKNDFRNIASLLFIAPYNNDAEISNSIH